MAYFEVGNTGPDSVMIRFRELTEAPSAYNAFEVDIMERIGTSYGKTYYFTVNDTDISFYTDTVGYRTSWVTFYGLNPDQLHRVWCYAVTNSTYPMAPEGGSVGGYASFYTDPIEADVPYPVANIDSVAETAIGIDWAAVPGAIEYDIFVNGDYYATATDLDHTIRDLQPDTYYGITMTAWVNGVESNYGWQVITEVKTYKQMTLPIITVGIVTHNSIAITWTASVNATSYILDILRDVPRESLPDVNLPLSPRSYTITGLIPNNLYYLRLDPYNSPEDNSMRGTQITVTTLAAMPRPLNWAWEYTILSGQPFYTQSGSTVFIMRAAHWNAFIARINEFRVYKGLAAYAFTTALTTHTPTQIKNCINQAIAAINAMGFAQSSVATNQDVAASTFITMRNNLNSIV